MMKAGLISFSLLLFATAAGGCAAQQATTPAPPIVAAPAHPLPFRGRLADGDPNSVPPAVAMSLSGDSPVTFMYREELTHDDYHIPLALTAFDPATYVGSPVGDLGVTAFASLSITEGDRVLGDYTAKVHVSKSYTLYKEPTHREVEDAARAAVREKIDEKLYRDESRLAQVFAAAGQSAAPAVGANQSSDPAPGASPPRFSAGGQ